MIGLPPLPWPGGLVAQRDIPSRGTPSSIPGQTSPSPSAIQHRPGQQTLTPFPSDGRRPLPSSLAGGSVHWTHGPPHPGQHTPCGIFCTGSPSRQPHGLSPRLTWRVPRAFFRPSPPTREHSPRPLASSGTPPGCSAHVPASRVLSERRPPQSPHPQSPQPRRAMGAPRDAYRRLSVVVLAAGVLLLGTSAARTGPPLDGETCPDYGDIVDRESMQGFDIERYQGIWYSAAVHEPSEPAACRCDQYNWCAVPMGREWIFALLAIVFGIVRVPAHPDIPLEMPRLCIAANRCLWRSDKQNWLVHRKGTPSASPRPRCLPPSTPSPPLFLVSLPSFVRRPALTARRIHANPSSARQIVLPGRFPTASPPLRPSSSQPASLLPFIAALPSQRDGLNTETMPCLGKGRSPRQRRTRTA
eukprot:evm.model.scf_1436.6 EVM.evm.TU.scf_1436.6   scf_1436:36247-37488(-)